MKTKKPLSIYIHIPFCVQKCLYCDFLSVSAGRKEQECYLQALQEEIQSEAGKYTDYEIQTIFIGGGTPSVVPAEWMQRILKTVSDCYLVASECEITIEVNPGTVDEIQLKQYKEAGINRLSIGLQSADNEELRLLGRIHTAEDFFETYKKAVKTGFNNINVDLMSAIPAQTVTSYKQTLETVLGLVPAPTHISAYSLIIEKGTPFFEHTPELPDEDTDREMYKITDDILSEKGYHRYEISNYALPGYECRHNLVYWQRGEYVGFGIGAASLVNEIRFQNAGTILGYSGDRKQESEVLTKEDAMAEYMFLGLRMTQGVSKEGFFRAFGKEMDEVYPGILDKLISEGLLFSYHHPKTKERYVALTEYGLDVSNVVMAEFLLK